MLFFIYFQMRNILIGVLCAKGYFYDIIKIMNSKKAAETVLFFRSPQRREWPANEKLEGIYRFARARRWNVVTLDPPQTEVQLRETITGWRPIGCLVDMDASRRIFTANALSGVPAVFLDFDDRLLGGLTFRVNHDPVAVSTLAAKRLTALKYENFAFIGYTQQWAWSRARLIAFKKALSHRGRKIRTFEMPAGRPPTTKERAAFDNFLAKLPRPCGLMLANDTLAEELYPACRRIGVSIPDDFAVIGVDDDEQLCNSLRPTLSSIRLDFKRAGWQLAELLYLRISGQAETPVVHRYGTLGVAPRESTALPSQIAPHDSLAIRIDKQIAAHALEKCSVAEIIAPLGCSRRSAETHYRAAKNKSILTAIREKRLEHAKKLLCETRISIADVATACGYQRAAHFAAYFRKQTAHTLLSYRKAYSR